LRRSVASAAATASTGRDRADGQRADDKLALALLENRFARGRHLLIDAADRELKFSKTAGVVREPRPPP
jgi:hypothetical protein